MEAPRIPSFIRLNKHKRFDYRPWFYDERKERLNKMKAAKMMEENETDERKVNLREHWSRSRRHSQNQSIARLLIITGFLFLLSYLLLFR